ncbi:hypothetical protein Z043_103077 [Scleropages formosus]|uniref:Uncharacterized protein n=1 Tax=Scleropages formosus TaxID=113540 RepID=A0A0P7VN86_SCLFO|nr:hypothetical protein Z043_103077 [Scleropages formosus]
MTVTRTRRGDLETLQRGRSLTLVPSVLPVLWEPAGDLLCGAGERRVDLRGEFQLSPKPSIPGVPRHLSPGGRYLACLHGPGEKLIRALSPSTSPWTGPCLCAKRRRGHGLATSLPPPVPAERATHLPSNLVEAKHHMVVAEPDEHSGRSRERNS